MNKVLRRSVLRHSVLRHSVLRHSVLRHSADLAGRMAAGLRRSLLAALSTPARDLRPSPSRTAGPLRALARRRDRPAWALLGPSRRTAFTRRVERLTRTRTEAMDAHRAELRRIERDLHDGIQARLVAVAMCLGLADHRFDADPGAARAHLLEARDGVEEALTQLRTMIRGIHPPILTDRGLAGALPSLAAGVPLPVELDVTGGRVPDTVEAAAYLVVAEALTGIAERGDAARASVTIRREAAHLRITVRDDGAGGTAPGTAGRAGIRRRVAALDGTVRVQGDRGKGTTLTIGLPCGAR